MKTIFLAAALLFTATAQAEDICAIVGKFAETTMQGRQTGVPMSHMMNYAETTKNELLKNLVIAAFSKPRFSSSEYQRAAVIDFRANAELNCYKIQKQGEMQ
jgi:hypothetical protein